MSTAEAIYEKAKHLPENLQTEALRYVDFLLVKRATEQEDKNWNQFSATQLASQYSAEDAIYDDE
jgi:hypothetical protein